MPRRQPENLVSHDPDEHEPMGHIVAQHQRTIESLVERVTKLEAQHGQVALSMPRIARPLSKKEVIDAIAENPSAHFEVLNDPMYRNAGWHMTKGKIINAQHYRDIPGHVASGLRVMGTEPH